MAKVDNNSQRNSPTSRPNTRSATRQRAHISNSQISRSTVNMNAGDVVHPRPPITTRATRAPPGAQQAHSGSSWKFVCGLLFIVVLLIVGTYVMYNKSYVGDIWITNNWGSNIKSAGRDYNEKQ